MTKGYIDLSNEVYEISSDFKALCSLIDTLHIAMSGDQVLEIDTIMTYTEIMKDRADKIAKKLARAVEMSEEEMEKPKVIMRMDPVTIGTPGTEQ